MITLSIITLNYKKKDLTLACLESVYQQYQNYFEDNVYEFFIVDNASDDDSVPTIQKQIKNKKYKNVQLIANKKNTGFGSGNNIGAFRSHGKFMLFLNNDTQVKDEGLSKMVQYMEEHQGVAILGGQLRNVDGSLQPSVGKFYTPFRALLLLLGMQRFGLLDRSPQNIEKVDWVKGGLLLIRRDVFEKLGGFDENIFMYTEDMELCYRAKMVGYNTYFYPFVTVLHAEHGSSSRTFAIVNIYKNLLYFYKKHRPRWEYMFIKFILWAKADILLSLGKTIHNGYLINTYEQALSVL